MLLAIATVWLLLAVLVGGVVAALGRAGLREDRACGYVSDRG
ncbi:hypothetical protein ACI79D_22470 [Geodermatophilus sp. SYSU D00708]